MVALRDAEFVPQRMSEAAGAPPQFGETDAFVLKQDEILLAKSAGRCGGAFSNTR